MVEEQPGLLTDRLRLRAFTLEDAPGVAKYCGDIDVARMTANIPHPYDETMAEDWIASHAEAYAAGEAATFALTIRETGELVGAIGIHVDKPNRAAEFGYWVGKPFWNQGYATEAARAILDFGFGQLRLHRIYARHMMKNPASGRVMQKAGMTFEGILRESIYRWESFEDAAVYSILAAEFEPTV
jgi:ribosomal-protein-alanine N-acetyltransferase